MSAQQPSTALENLCVLDLTRVRAGPTCCRILSDFGADVIKIEAPPGVDPNEGMSGARDGSDMLNLHRNKRSLTLNLKEQAGHEIFMRLVRAPTWWWKIFGPTSKSAWGSRMKDSKQPIRASFSHLFQDSGRAVLTARALDLIRLRRAWAALCG